MGNNCSCLNFCHSETEAEPQKEVNPIPTGKLQSYLINFKINYLIKDFHLMTDPEDINKIIKIQSYIRGMSMRDKIKLRGRPKNKNIKTETVKKTEFSYENTINQKAEENDEFLQKKYNEIIVIYNYYLMI